MKDLIQAHKKLIKTVKEQMGFSDYGMYWLAFLEGGLTIWLLDRIFFHTKTINDELTKKTSSGKKIDFILQELFRESNTLSVKIDDSKLKNYALDMKLLVEEMREQTQNVE